MSSDREKIAKRIKEARVFAGLSQLQAANKLGIQRPTISEIEAGRRRVSAEELIQIANLYKVDTTWLLLQDADRESIQFKFAARELSKLSVEDRQKLLDLLKVLPW